MNKAILIEDRIERQRKQLGQRLNELQQFSFLKNISGGEDFADFKRQIVKKNYSIFDEYTTIMLHRSAFDAEMRNGFLEYLKDYPKKLIFFSGGITGSQLSKLKNIEFMLINVTEFYSDNLFVFLKNNTNNMLELAFGENWRTSMLIDSIEKLTLYEKAYAIEKPYSRIESDLELNNAFLEKYFIGVKSNESKIKKEELGIILKQMNIDLKSIL